MLYHLNRLQQEEGAVQYDALRSDLQNNYRSGARVGIISRTEATSKTTIETTLESLQSSGAVKVTTNSDGERRIRLHKEHIEQAALLSEANSAVQQFFSHHISHRNLAQLGIDR